MDKTKLGLFHGLVEQLGRNTLALVYEYSKSRTYKLEDLKQSEFNLMLRDLQEERENKCKKSRGIIINRLCLMGYQLPDGNPDYKRINAFIKNIGSNNPGKKKLYWVPPSDLNKIVSQVKAMYRSTINQDAK